MEGKGPFPLHDSLHLHILNLLDAVELPGAVAGGGADEMPDFADVDGRFLRGVFAEQDVEIDLRDLLVADGVHGERRSRA